MKKKKKKRGSLVWCGCDQPGVFPHVAGVPLGIWVRGGMGWDGIRAVGCLGERLVGGELYGVFVLSCLRIWFGRGICLGGWLLNLHHETQSAPHRMACLFAQFPLCTSAVPSSPFCPPRDRTCPALSFPTCSAICASLYRSMDI